MLIDDYVNKFPLLVDGNINGVITKRRKGYLYFSTLESGDLSDSVVLSNNNSFFKNARIGLGEQVNGDLYRIDYVLYGTSSCITSNDNDLFRAVSIVYSNIFAKTPVVMNGICIKLSEDLVAEIIVDRDDLHIRYHYCDYSLLTIDDVGRMCMVLNNIMLLFCNDLTSPKYITVEPYNKFSDGEYHRFNYMSIGRDFGQEYSIDASVLFALDKESIRNIFTNCVDKELGLCASLANIITLDGSNVLDEAQLWARFTAIEHMYSLNGHMVEKRKCLEDKYGEFIKKVQGSGLADSKDEKAILKWIRRGAKSYATGNNFETAIRYVVNTLSGDFCNTKYIELSCSLRNKIAHDGVLHDSVLLSAVNDDYFYWLTKVVRLGLIQFYGVQSDESRQ